MTINRRDFMKATGTAAGFAIAAGYSPLSYAQNEKVRVGCIGTGGQGTFHIRQGLAGTEEIEIAAVCDVFAPNQKYGVLFGQASNAGVVLGEGETPNDEQKAKAKEAFRPVAYYNYKEMLEKEQLDAVVIATPLDTHFQIAMDCFDAGKFVFLEKTMCFDIDQARAIVQKCHETGKFCQTGHQRRYNAYYNLAMKMAWDERKLGRINHIDMQWHRNSNWRRPVPTDYTLNEQEAQYIQDIEKHLNWRIYRERSGGLCTELLTHQIDVATWFLGKLPSRVYGYGGLDYWRDGRTVPDNISLCYEYDLSPGDPGFTPIDKRSQYQKINQINKGYTVRVVYTSILANAKKGATELLQGDLGAVQLAEIPMFCKFFPEVPDVSSSAAPAGGDPTPSAGSPPVAGSADELASKIATGGSLRYTKEMAEGSDLPVPAEEWITPDIVQFRAFAHHIRNGGKPKTNEMVGLANTIAAVCAMEAIEQKKQVEIKPEWGQFDFETPSFHMYG